MIYHPNVRFDEGDMLVLDGDVYVWEEDRLNRPDMCRLLELNEGTSNVSNVEVVHVDDLDTKIGEANSFSLIRGAGKEILDSLRE